MFESFCFDCEERFSFCTSSHMHMCEQKLSKGAHGAAVVKIENKALKHVCVRMERHRMLNDTKQLRLFRETRGTGDAISFQNTAV